MVAVLKVTWLSDDGRYFNATISRLYKGELQTGTIRGINDVYCDPVVKQLGSWLIYGTAQKDGFYVEPCGLARSIQQPELNRDFNVVPAPQPPPGSGSEAMDAATKRKQEGEAVYVHAARETLAVELATLEKLCAP